MKVRISNPQEYMGRQMVRNFYGNLFPRQKMAMGVEYYALVDPEKGDQEVDVFPVEDDAIVSTFVGKKGRVVGRLLGKIVFLPNGYNHEGDTYVSGLEDRGNFLVAQTATPAKWVSQVGVRDPEFKVLSDEGLRLRASRRISFLSEGGKKFYKFIGAGALPDAYNVFELSK